MHPVYLSTVFVKLARRVGLRAGPGPRCISFGAVRVDAAVGAALSRSPAGPSAIRRATAASTAVRSSTPICSLDVPAPCPATCTGSHRAPASSRSSPVVGPRDARPTRRTMYAALASHAAALASVPSHSPAPPLATPSAARWSPSAPPAHGVAAASRRSALHGSSPRARGTQPSVRYRLVAPWFIPAYAGNTILGCPQGECRAVYPACVGNTSCRSARLAGSAVYPRVRGTHRKCAARPLPLGSSPRSGNLVEAHCPRFLSCARLCAVGSQPIWRA